MELEPGVYQATPVSWGIREASKSQAMAVSIDWAPTARLAADGKTWDDCGNGEVSTVSGDLWIVRADGGVNERAVETLEKVLGWSGDLADIENTDAWKPPPAQIEIEEDEWPVGSGKVQLKVAWVNPIGGGVVRGRVSKARVDELAAKFGDRFKRVMRGEGDVVDGDSIPF